MNHMKKCKNCGTVQSNDKNTCIDCGTVLGRPMSKAEEESIEAALDEKLDNMADRTEDFYVPLRDKILGVICIIGIVAAVLLISFCAAAKQQIQNDIPDGVIVTQTDGATVIVSDGSTPEYDFPSSRMHTLGKSQMYAIISIVALIVAAPMLFFPKFTWLISTLKYRLFYNWDTTPSYFAIIIRKVATYLMFAIGTGSVLYGYWLYF